MEIIKIDSDRRAFMNLLLLADEQPELVEAYIDQGELFALYDQGLETICLVEQIDDETCEIKNIATTPEHQGHGYGKKMIEYLENYYKTQYNYILVGTGESPKTVPFYENCGFNYAFRINDFFKNHYDHPIFEDGVELKDKVYFRKSLK
ncbi:MAG: GNAT family N-acetyltransferase [Clostridia bacterium]|nr:GNAT family N-acetyltransferase [Clostridia bacterium]